MHLICVQGWTCSLLRLLLLLFLLCFSDCSRHYIVILEKSLRILSISWLPNCMEIDIHQPCSNVLWGLIGFSPKTIPQWSQVLCFHKEIPLFAIRIKLKHSLFSSASYSPKGKCSRLALIELACSSTKQQWDWYSSPCVTWSYISSWCQGPSQP